jgi:hypothetical protein
MTSKRIETILYQQNEMRRPSAKGSRSFAEGRLISSSKKDKWGHRISVLQPKDANPMSPGESRGRGSEAKRAERSCPGTEPERAVAKTVQPSLGTSRLGARRDFLPSPRLPRQEPVCPFFEHSLGLFPARSRQRAYAQVGRSRTLILSLRDKIKRHHVWAGVTAISLT